ncbi:MAG: domain S-box-containing protein [Solirubrobacterales bacterium]|nr:domain S-box-containing protein [Solirubrobacterales bacterium]
MARDGNAPASAPESPTKRSFEQGEQLTRTGIWEWDLDTDALVWSSNMWRLLGLEPGSVTPSPEFVLGRVHPDDREQVEQQLDLAKREGKPPAPTYRTIWDDGSVHVLRSYPTATEEHEGRTRMIGAVQDITELSDSERLATETLILMETLSAAAPVGFAFVDRDFRIVRINETLAEINGSPRCEQIGRTVAEVVPDVWSQMESVYRRALEDGEATTNLEVERLRSGERGPRYWLASYYPVRTDEVIIGVGVVVTDITERYEAQRFREAVMDTMVEGLYALDKEGHVTFMNSAASKLLGWTEDELRGRSMHGAIHSQRADGTPHPEYECELLKVRTEGRSVCISHDAFTRKDGTIFPVAYSAAPLMSGPAVDGVVVVFRDASIEQAEEQRAKWKLDELAWVGRIRDALDQDRLVLYSQPIVALSGETPSQELLLRMIGSDGSIIAPGSFLPVAEQYGLIGEIDRWVISRAVRMAAEGQRVEANLSASSVGNLDLLGVIERELRDAQADPANVVFEITETVLMQDVETGKAFAHGLAAIGCQLALDDFGTGFGSFTYLKTIPVSYLKIDIDFVRDLEANPANQILVKAIVGLARGFGCRTIAEGVEDPETLALLREYGVDFAQGFYLGRPGPIAAV